MTNEPNLHTHIIGFPDHVNSKNNNNNDSAEKKNASLDASIYKPLYELSNKYLEDGYSILYAAESVPNDRDKAKVIENIQNANTDNIKEIQSNISRGLVTVLDSDLTYKENARGIGIADFLLSNVSNIQQKSQQQKKSKGTMIFNAPDPFFSRQKYDVFMVFEEKIDKALPRDVGLLCWYKLKWLNKLSLSYTISFLTHHKYTIHNDWKYKEWNTNKIIDVVSKSIDNNLGKDSAILLFQTMKSAYKLKPDSIVDRPAIFEETLKRILGKDDANSVINSIFEEIIEEVEFSLTGNSSNKR